MADGDLLFTGLVFVLHGRKDKEQTALITRSGGRIESGVGSATTHVVVNVYEKKGKSAPRKLPAVKSNKAVKIIHPQWLAACEREGHRVPTAGYELQYPYEAATAKWAGPRGGGAGGGAAGRKRKLSEIMGAAGVGVGGGAAGVADAAGGEDPVRQMLEQILDGGWVATVLSRWGAPDLPIMRATEDNLASAAALAAVVTSDAPHITPAQRRRAKELFRTILPDVDPIHPRAVASIRNLRACEALRAASAHPHAFLAKAGAHLEPCASRNQHLPLALFRESFLEAPAEGGAKGPAGGGGAAGATGAGSSPEAPAPLTRTIKLRRARAAGMMSPTPPGGSPVPLVGAAAAGAAAKPAGAAPATVIRFAAAEAGEQEQRVVAQRVPSSAGGGGGSSLILPPAARGLHTPPPPTLTVPVNLPASELATGSSSGWLPRVQQCLQVYVPAQSFRFEARLQARGIPVAAVATRVRMMWRCVPLYELLTILHDGVGVGDTLFTSVRAALEDGCRAEIAAAAAAGAHSSPPESVCVLLCSCLSDDAPTRSIPVLDRGLLELQRDEIRQELIKDDSQRARLAHIEDLIATATANVELKPVGGGGGRLSHPASLLPPVASVTVARQEDVLVHFALQVQIAPTAT